MKSQAPRLGACIAIILIAVRAIVVRHFTEILLNSCCARACSHAGVNALFLNKNNGLGAKSAVAELQHNLTESDARHTARLRNHYSHG
ncbi:hypothetical protein [uncultured Ramlibacter sp.]|uniref:hypothetical protein n=1 Tax=uncultured Ramlibacter sp. TaxID=260755 RepID=UPI00263591C6|nr:hypothetical protein [uncultured Ramlibacter sp.]